MKYTAMQAWQLKNFGMKTYFMNEDGEVKNTAVNVGCMGCGKTYSTMQAFGLYLLKLKRLGYSNLGFILMGRTRDIVQKVMCNQLAELFGSDFRFDNSRKSGFTCNARLFGFPIYIVGVNDTTSEERNRGLSNIVGIIVEELALINHDEYLKFKGRLRNNIDLPEEFANPWVIANTNPEAPTNWVLKDIQAGKIKLIQWKHKDAGWKGFAAKMKSLKEDLADNPAFYERYVLGRWKVAEGLVFSCFNAKKNVIEGDIDYSYVLRSWIAVDYGSNHKTSVQVHHMLKTGIRIVETNVTFTRTSVSTICNKIEELYDEQLSLNHVKTINIYVDGAAQAVVDQLREDGITALNAKKDVMPGNTYVNEQFNSGMLIILLNEGTQELIDEIYGYKYKETPNAKDGEVVKIDDDCCDAMRYGVYSDAKYNNAY